MLQISILLTLAFSYLVLFPGYLVYEINRLAGRSTLSDYCRFLLALAVGSIFIPAALLFGPTTLLDLGAGKGCTLCELPRVLKTAQLEVCAIGTILFILPHFVGLALNYFHKEQKFRLGASFERKRLLRDVSLISTPMLLISLAMLVQLVFDVQAPRSCASPPIFESTLNGVPILVEKLPLPE